MSEESVRRQHVLQEYVDSMRELAKVRYRLKLAEESVELVRKEVDEQRRKQAEIVKRITDIYGSKSSEECGAIVRCRSYVGSKNPDQFFFVQGNYITPIQDITDDE